LIFQMQTRVNNCAIRNKKVLYEIQVNVCVEKFKITCVEIRTSVPKLQNTSPSTIYRPEQPALKHHPHRKILVPAMKIIF